MAKRITRWMWVNALRSEEKAVITSRCERFIREDLTLDDALERLRTDELLQPLQ